MENAPINLNYAKIECFFSVYPRALHKHTVPHIRRRTKLRIDFALSTLRHNSRQKSRECPDNRIENVYKLPRSIRHTERYPRFNLLSVQPLFPVHANRRPHTAHNHRDTILGLQKNNFKRHFRKDRQENEEKIPIK